MHLLYEYLTVFQTVFPTPRGRTCSVACKNPIEKRLDIRGGDAFPSDPHRNATIAQYRGRV